MTNAFTVLTESLMPRCYGQVVAALASRIVLLLALLVLAACTSC